jgi:hypothetical protein
MTTKKTTTRNEKSNSGPAIRVSKETSIKSKQLILKANKIMGGLGKKVMPDDLINLALDHVNDEDLKRLKINSLRQTDIDKLLYLTFIKEKLGSSKEDFSAFTKGPDYYPFVTRNKSVYMM